MYKKHSSIQLFVFLCCFITHKTEQEEFKANNLTDTA